MCELKRIVFDQAVIWSRMTVCVVESSKEEGKPLPAAEFDSRKLKSTEGLILK